MKLTDQERAEYDEKISEIVQIIATDGEEARQLFTSEHILAREMLPEEPVNQRVLTTVKGAHLGFTVSELKRAMAAHFRQVLRHEKRSAMLGINPANEREFVAAFMSVRQYDMDYHRKWWQGGARTDLSVEDMVNDARLTAGDLDMLKPRGDLLAVNEIKAALSEWASRRRAERKHVAIQRVMRRLTAAERSDVFQRFREEVCERYFPAEEARFNEAACLKHIWQVKNRAAGRRVKQIHMLVLVGPQDTGKTEFCKFLYGPIGELAAEVSLRDALDTRQMDMPQYLVLFTDEMAFAEDAKPAQLKTFLTGTSPSRRPMGMNISEKIDLNATLIATANHSLDRVIYDSSGMRRFVEIRPRPRIEIEPYWDGIEAFPWLKLWQAVDIEDVDPLISQFKAELMVKQETIRNLDNTEIFLREFNPSENRDWRRAETSTPERMEFFSMALYKHCFRPFEDDFCPGFRTTLQRWGRDMRSLIDNGRVSDWSYKIIQNKTVYVRTCPQQQTGSSIIPLPLDRKRR